MRARSPENRRRLQRQPRRTARARAGLPTWWQRRDTRRVGPGWARGVDTTLWCGGGGRGGVQEERFPSAYLGRSFKVRNSAGPPASIGDQRGGNKGTGPTVPTARGSSGHRPVAPPPSVGPSVKTLPDLHSRMAPGVATAPRPKLGAQDHGQPALQKHGPPPPSPSRTEATRGPTLFLELKELPKMRRNPLRSGRLGDTYCIQEFKKKKKSQF